MDFLASTQVSLAKRYQTDVMLISYRSLQVGGFQNYVNSLTLFDSKSTTTTEQAFGSLLPRRKNKMVYLKTLQFSDQPNLVYHLPMPTFCP